MPELIEVVNRETVPVWLNYSDTGFPRLPAFANHHRNELPWFRLNVAHVVMMDGYGQRLYGGGHEILTVRTLGQRELIYGQSFDDNPLPIPLVVAALDRFHEHQRLLKAAADDASVRPELQACEKRLSEWYRSAYLPQVEPRLWTATIMSDFIGPNPWRLFVERFRHPGPGKPENLVPGVRNAALHGFAAVAYDTSPLLPLAQQVMDAWYATWASGNVDDPAVLAAAKFAAAHPNSPIPYAVRYRAAKGVESTAGVQIFQGGEEEDVVATFQRWYDQAKDDPQYRVVWPDDPSQRYIHYLDPFSAECAGDSCSASPGGACAT